MTARDRSLLFGEGEAGERRAGEVRGAAAIYHRGVLRVAGVVHVGTAPHRARCYALDARGYVAGGIGEIEASRARLRAAVEGYSECEARSWVSAVEVLLTWGLS